MTRAVVYTRVSKATKSRYGDVLTFDQEPRLQEAPLRRLAEQRGWTITKVYTDRMSGGKENRPALAELLTDARRGAFDVVLVWRFDRLSRSVIHFLQIVQELRLVNVDLVSHEQGFDTSTVMGKFTLTMFAALAELEREVIQERVRAGLDYAREHGTRSGKAIGRPRRIFDRGQVALLREQGRSWPEIARTLRVGVGTAVRAYQGLTVAPEPFQNRIPEVL